jgi:hypothetical protein
VSHERKNALELELGNGNGFPLLVLSNKKETALGAKLGKEDGSSMDQEQALWIPHKEKLSLVTLKG